MRVTTQGDMVTVEASEHNHAPSKAELEALRVRSVIRDKATKTRDGSTLNIAESSGDVSPSALAQLPALQSMRTIGNIRQKKLGAPAIPKDLK